MDLIGFKGIIFIIASLLAVISSLFMVTRKNPVHSALWMIVTFFAMAVIYLILNAQFIAVAQVMVYAGAIMMLILFVIMLVHMETGGEGAAGTERRPLDRRGQRRRRCKIGRRAALRPVPVPLRDSVGPAFGGDRGRSGPFEKKVRRDAWSWKYPPPSVTSSAASSLRS